MIVNTTHSNTEDSTTDSLNLKMNHIASMFSGKFIMVPITVSLIASVHAFLLLDVILLIGQTGLSVLVHLVCSASI
jgi:hypothetical protein